MISRFVKWGPGIIIVGRGEGGELLGVSFGSDRIEDCGVVSSSLLRPRKTMLPV